MGALKTVEMCSSSSSSSIGGGGDYDDDDAESWLSELREKQEKDLKNLSLTSQPFYTLYLFIWATYLHISYILRKGWIFLAIIFLAVATGYLLLPEKHFQECLHFCRYGLWWIILGVASSIGLGYGLHTFVMYLGPHIALFTVRAVECGRIDLKAAPYDTIQWNTHPSWHEKECFYFGLPLFSSLPNSLFSIPLGSILPQIQLEAVLWGIGTALGELPPYFVSRAARKSGNTVDVIEEIDASSSGKGIISIFMKRSKCWLFSRAYHLNFFTILLLASVPNPLFDLAGMMCGQFGIPFWKFFLSTLIGKAIIKTHIQTVFIIILCNNQLLDWMENELVRVLGHIPVFGEMLSKLIFRLKMLKEKILSPPADLPSGTKGKYWGRYFNLIWNAVIWLMMINFVIKIVTSTAKEQLRKQQEIKLNKKRSLLLNSGKYNHITEVTSDER